MTRGLTVSGGTCALPAIRTRRGTSMRVVDIVIGVGWVIFWVGWFAASAGVLCRAVASTYASIASVIASPALRGFPVSHQPVTCLHDRGRGVRCRVWRAGRGPLGKEQAERHDKGQDL